MAVKSEKERGVQNRGVPNAPAWATEPPVWGEPISFQHLRQRFEELERKKVYRFAYPDGSMYETTWKSQSAAEAWASINGHRYLGKVEVERPVERTSRDLGSRGTEPPLTPPPLIPADPIKLNKPDKTPPPPRHEPTKSTKPPVPPPPPPVPKKRPLPSSKKAPSPPPLMRSSPQSPKAPRPTQQQRATNDGRPSVSEREIGRSTPPPFLPSVPMPEGAPEIWTV